MATTSLGTLLSVAGSLAAMLATAARVGWIPASPAQLRWWNRLFVFGFCVLGLGMWLAGVQPVPGP